MNKNNIEFEIPDFKPYKVWKVGSNTLKNVKYFINISGYIPLIIGRENDKPSVWLYALIDNKIVPLIDNNNSKNIQIFPILSKENCLEWKLMNLQTKELIYLLRLEYSDDSISITHLDLRSIGIKIFIENNALIVGSARLEGNTIEGGNSFIYIED